MFFSGSPNKTEQKLLLALDQLITSVETCHFDKELYEEVTRKLLPFLTKKEKKTVSETSPPLHPKKDGKESEKILSVLLNLIVREIKLNYWKRPSQSIRLKIQILLCLCPLDEDRKKLLFK